MEKRKMKCMHGNGALLASHAIDPVTGVIVISIDVTDART
jgi:hypothetical protein